MRSMLKDRKLQCVLVLLVALAAGFLILLRNPEPRYGGRPLSSWVAELEWYDEDVSSVPGDVLRERARRAREALKDMGAEALPYLLRWVRYETARPSLFRGLAQHFGWLTDAPRRMADGTPTAFRLLGPTAAPAVPRLLAHARSGPWEVRCRSLEALAAIGPPALEAMTTLLSDPNSRIRWLATLRLAGFGTNAAPAVPRLLELLSKDAEALVQGAAASTLGCLQLQPSVVVPALISAAHSTRAEVRSCALSALLRFGPEARPALPLLLAARKAPDADTNLVAAIERALPTIAPGLLTNAPVQ